MARFFKLLILFGFLFNLLLAEFWQNRAHCPRKVEAHSTAACRVGKDVIYAWIGPYTETLVYRYNTKTNTWGNPISTGGKRRRGACIAWDSVLNRVHFIYVKLDETYSHKVFLVDSNIWRTLKPPPPPFKHSKKPIALSKNDMVWVRYRNSSYLFAFSAPFKKDFYFLRYNVANDSWTLAADPPRKIEPGAALCWSGDSFIYAFTGWSGKWFYRYCIPKDTWTRLADVNITDDVNCGSLVYRKRASGDEIYAFTTRGKNWFRRYKVNKDSWDVRLQTPADYNEGSALVIMPGDTIYAFRGGDTTFWRYIPDFNDYSNEGKGLIAGFDALEKDEPESGIEDVQNPGWSNDGQWIIFSKYDTITGSYQIFKRRPDGSEETQITFDESDYTEPKWAPDSNLIACIIDDKLGLIKPDGSGKVILDNEKFCCYPLLVS